MISKRKTLSVGIPAHNEGQNIAGLLQSIISKKQIDFTIEKIIVVCDGCTDDTEKIATGFSKSDYRIEVHADGKRLGKMKRLMEIYSCNNSDYVVVFDADIVLENNLVLSNMIKGFNSPGVCLVGGNSRPVRAKPLFGRMVNAWSRVWYEARLSFRNGNNVHNSRGCALALEKNFAMGIRIPEDIISDSQYLYFAAVSQGKKFKFAKNACVYYRKPDNFQDFLLEKKRSDPEDVKLSREFGNWIYKEYRIPSKYKLLALFRCLISDPVFTTLGAINNLLLEKLSDASASERQNKVDWQTVTSTKKAIILEEV